MKLTKGEGIVTAYAEAAGGPGWANTPVWVIVRGADGTLREECLQPNEQTPGMITLYVVSAAANYAMRAEVGKMIQAKTMRKIKK